MPTLTSPTILWVQSKRAEPPNLRRHTNFLNNSYAAQNPGQMPRVLCMIYMGDETSTSSMEIP